MANQWETNWQSTMKHVTGQLGVGKQSLTQIMPSSYTPSYENIIKMIQAMGNQPSYMETYVPAVAELMGSSTTPAIQEAGRQTAANVAAAQSDAMKRGITGSSTEALGMGQARGQGQQVVANIMGQQAAQMAQVIIQAAQGDIAANRDTLLALAQAMGQELTSQRDIAMFQEQLKNAVNLARQQASEKRAAGIGGLIGTGLGAGLGAFWGPAGAAIGASTGGGLGSVIGGGIGGGQ